MNGFGHDIARWIVCGVVIWGCAGMTLGVEFAGGTGEPNDPYQIATAEQLIAIGSDPNLLDKHFLLIADIDLDPNLPGRQLFDKAVIGSARPVVSRIGYFVDGVPFTGVFDGSGHTISHLTINGEDCVGLWGLLEPGAEIRDVGLVNVNIAGSQYVGGLVAYNHGGRVIRCRSTGTIQGYWRVGGLVGYNNDLVIHCHSKGAVTGNSEVGGLAGFNAGNIAQCYSMGPVNGVSYIGGLLGSNRGDVAHCYSNGLVIGLSNAGGLMGGNVGVVSFSVWDIESSGLAASAAGVGLTTAEMMDPEMLGLNGFAEDPNWILNAGCDYPRLVWEATPGCVVPEPTIDWLEGAGIAQTPYQIGTVDQLILLGKASILWDKHFILDVDIDLDPNLPGRGVLEQALIRAFTGVFDGNDHTISHLTIRGAEYTFITEATAYIGLFGVLASGAEVRNLGVVDVNIVSAAKFVGGLSATSYGSVTHCYTTGAVSGDEHVGGLLGSTNGSVTRCHSIGRINGYYCVGGLAGVSRGVVTESYSAGAINGDTVTGGLVGDNFGTVTMCYGAGTVSGRTSVGGLVGSNDWVTSIAASYSTAAVTGTKYVGGLVGYSIGGISTSYSTGMVTGEDYVGGLTGRGGARSSFWDVQTSGQTDSAGGIGKTTVAMWTANTYLDAGPEFFDPLTSWDFENVWMICEGQDYPRLQWEGVECSE